MGRLWSREVERPEAISYQEKAALPFKKPGSFGETIEATRRFL
jgi:hypothetical protein